MQALIAFWLLLAAATAEALTTAGNGTMHHYADVIIVGAGMAGVAAARQLQDAGRRVLLLEARPRAGGRLHSVQTPVGRVDMGAMWIHEASPGNQLYDLARALGSNLSRPQDYGSASVFLPNGTRANLLSYLAVYTAHFAQVRGRITAMRAAAAGSSSAAADVPLSALFTQFVERNRARWRPDQLALVNLVMHTEFQTLLNGNITQLSSLRFGDAKTLPNLDVLLQQGFDSLVQAMLPGLRISYNTVITGISQNDTAVTLTTKNGSRLTAPHALVTLPLGVLKAKAVAWDPPLPAAKQAAINNMGMGVLDKLVLVFPAIFWDRQSDFISVAPTDWSGRWSVWLNYAKTWGVPVLVALNPADTAQALEQLSNGALLAEAMQVLNLIYGNASSRPLPAPIQVHVTRWQADPFARGAYSYFATGNPLNITDTLGRPFGRVLFAGEATSEKPGTVLGALLSGGREAARLQQLLQHR